MNATLTHVVFRVTGEPLQLAAFDARLKLLFAEHGIADGVDEQHAANLLHYDLKVAGGIPFPPFALASADFPELAVAVEWVDTGSGVRGSATIARGELTAQNVENIAAVGPGHQIAIHTNADGSLALAVALVRTGRDECRGYVLTSTRRCVVSNYARCRRGFDRVDDDRGRRRMEPRVADTAGCRAGIPRDRSFANYSSGRLSGTRKTRAGFCCAVDLVR